MSKIETADLILDADEPTYGMSVFEDSTGFCTRVVVIRGGLPVGVVVHHGPSEYSGKIPPLFVPSEGENSVGLMMEMSEAHRQDLRWYDRAKAQLEGSTLIKDIINQEWELTQRSKNRSTFGPHVSIQRNGHNSTQVRRDWFDERDRRTGQKRFFQ